MALIRAAMPVDPDEKMVGLLTHTIVRSPVIHWVLHARIRHRTFNDVVFVGDDFLHVKQVKSSGTLDHIATKANFDGRIRAARVISNYRETPDEDLFIKIEDGYTDLLADGAPSQCVVLTLDTNDVVFLWLASNADGTLQFQQRGRPLPRFDRLLYQPGQHLAVDPQSRALAVAAHENEVVIFSVKAKEKVQEELQDGRADWCPISAQRPLQVQGTIQLMDFLIPPRDDQGAEDEDYIILLLVVMDQGKIRAVWIDWYVSKNLHQAQIHAGQPLEVAKSVPSLLIPLYNAGFILVHGDEVKIWKNILSGPATSMILDAFETEVSCPGSSPRRPIWANWCRPRRGLHANRDTDHIYLIQEDGTLYLIQVDSSSAVVSNAGSFHCHIGGAFASLGDSRDPDVLVAAGNMSDGKIMSIGSWFTTSELSEQSRKSWAEPEWIESIKNWASVTDMVVSQLPGRSQRSRDGIFVTSGRQPFGAVTEIRQGLAANLVVYFEDEGLKSVTNVWTLPYAAVGNVLALLSSPTGTRMYEIAPTKSLDHITEVDGDAIGLEPRLRTLAASITNDGKILQVTEESLCLSLGSSTNFEDCATVRCPEHCKILAAAIHATSGFAVTATRSDDTQASFMLQYFRIHADDDFTSGDAQIERLRSCVLHSEPLSVALFASSDSHHIAVVATADGALGAFEVDSAGSLSRSGTIVIPVAIDGISMCDNIIILQSDTRSLAVCGLRDGRLMTQVVDTEDSDIFVGGKIIQFSISAVRLSQPPNVQAFAYAMSGPDTCLLTWNGNAEGILSIENIWLSDRLQPAIAQGEVVACTNMPPAHMLRSADLADSLVMITGEEFLVANLDRTTSTVPRQVPVSGTPNRLIYSEHQRCLVCASLQYGVRWLPSDQPHTGPEEKRQVWPVIDFIPARSSASSFSYELQPGERMYALLEWSFKLDDDKIYQFILVGGSYTRPSGPQRGRILFLRPQNKNWKVVDVKESHSMKFDEPVYALAQYDENRLLVCVGQTVVLYRFDTETRRMRQACLPLKLASPGTQISISFSNRAIQVSTLRDGLASLRLLDTGQTGEGYDTELIAQSMAPRADDLLSHVEFTESNDQGHTIKTGNVLASTKYGQLLGLRPHPPGPRNTLSTELLYEVQLPRSLTRLRECHIRPRWKPKLPDGMDPDNVIGCSADGSIVGIATLKEPLWRRLSWLQLLCEWSEQLSPFSHARSAYTVGEGTYTRNERLMPIGLARSDQVETRTDEVAMVVDDVVVDRPEEVVMKTHRPRLRDAHIDGDVLGRLLEQKDPEATMRRILSEVAERNDAVGAWMKVHLQEELAAVDEVVDILRRALEGWM